MGSGFDEPGSRATSRNASTAAARPGAMFVVFVVFSVLAGIEG
jgi:hypothetical protein